MKSIMKSSHLFFTYTVAFIPKIILYALFSGTIPSAGNHKTVSNYECLQAKQLGAGSCVVEIFSGVALLLAGMKL
jgi:hypothetical protein